MSKTGKLYDDSPSTHLLTNICRGVASVALRSLAHAAECLTDRREQNEVLEIFTRINKETGWRIAFVFKELKERWGWKDEPGMPQPHITSNTDPTPRPIYSQHQQRTSSVSYPQQDYSNNGVASYNQATMLSLPNMQQAPNAAAVRTASTSSGANASPGSKRPPPGIVNPMFATADFSMPQHPYQKFYVAPNHAHHAHHGYSIGVGDGNVGGLNVGMNTGTGIQHTNTGLYY